MMSTILADYNDWLWKTATGILHPSHRDLEDLVQEGRIALWRAYESYEPDRGALPFWLTFRARGHMLEVAMRRHYTGQPAMRYGRNPTPAEHIPVEPETLEDTLAASGHIEDAMLAYHDGEIAKAVGTLTPSQRKYVMARFWGGMTDREMVTEGVFSYDAHALWTAKDGARDRLAQELVHLA